MVAAQELLPVRIRDNDRIGVLKNLVCTHERAVHLLCPDRRLLQIADGLSVHGERANAVAVLLEKPRDVGVDHVDALLAHELQLFDAFLHRAVKIDTNADQQRNSTDEDEDDNHLRLDACILKHPNTPFI